MKEKKDLDGYIDHFEQFFQNQSKEQSVQSAQLNVLRNFIGNWK